MNPDVEAEIRKYLNNMFGTTAKVGTEYLGKAPLKVMRTVGPVVAGFAINPTFGIRNAIGQAAAGIAAGEVVDEGIDQLLPEVIYSWEDTPEKQNQRKAKWHKEEEETHFDELPYKQQLMTLIKEDNKLRDGRQDLFEAESTKR